MKQTDRHARSVFFTFPHTYHPPLTRPGGRGDIAAVVR